MKCASWGRGSCGGKGSTPLPVGDVLNWSILLQSPVRGYGVFGFANDKCVIDHLMRRHQSPAYRDDPEAGNHTRTYTSCSWTH
ncbi:hypothetical protein AVEN_131807-1 [Araneus ventricosus]|uniref:Uncharacterized protein n=1 Tax=Araneus ventricosus TaxID=182803 RepID=A0A4Y2SHW2_ARAVE|nr:hypothetical protein AVEN_131807-1 [Araneus ventricosus]